MLRITAYSEKLLADLDTIDWSDSLKQMQRNWIGRSEGAEVDFQIADCRLPIADSKIRVFTTRPDTLFGATYMVLSPEHKLVDQITTPEQKQAVEDYKKFAAGKSDLERTELAKEKTGVFTGAYAINPVNGENIPIWIADYVLASYGTGAIMAVPAHDERDWEFVIKHTVKVPARMSPKDVEGEPDVVWVSAKRGTTKIKICFAPKIHLVQNQMSRHFVKKELLLPASPENHFAFYGKSRYSLRQNNQRSAHARSQEENHLPGWKKKASAKAPSTSSCGTGSSAVSVTGVNRFPLFGKKARTASPITKRCRKVRCRYCRRRSKITSPLPTASHRSRVRKIG